ncbi:hypothetical protein NUM3379_36370 [Kineococcus sp. NUM-3379]
MSGPAVTALTWVLVAPGEPGLLHRLRPVVRERPDAVLVLLDAPRRDVPGAQVGLARGSGGRALTGLVWFTGLTAGDVEVLLRSLAAGATGIPAGLEHRAVVPVG